MAEVVDRSLERVRRRRNDIEFDARVIAAGRCTATAAGLSRAVLNLLDNAAKWSPPGGAGRCASDADRPVARRAGGVRLTVRAFRRRNAGWCSSGSTGRHPPVRCPARVSAWRSSNRWCSNTVARLRVEDTVPGGQPPGHLDPRGAARPTDVRRDAHRNSTRHGGARTVLELGDIRTSWGARSLGMSRTFSKWILSPAGHPERAAVVVPDVRNLLQEEHPSDMTNHPRYSPPPRQPGHRPGRAMRNMRRPVTPARNGPARIRRLSSSPTTGVTRRSSTFRHAATTRTGGCAPYRRPACRCPRRRPEKRSRAGALTAGAVAVAVVSAGIGGGVAMLAQPDRPHGRRRASRRGAQRARRQPARRLGRAGRGQGGAQRGEAGDRHRAGSPKRARASSCRRDGLILTNNHVRRVPRPREPCRRPECQVHRAGPGAQTKVTFADGRTTTFTVVGTDPSSDIAVVRAQGASGLTPITLGSSANLRVGQDVVADRVAARPGGHRHHRHHQRAEPAGGRGR